MGLSLGVQLLQDQSCLELLLIFKLFVLAKCLYVFARPGSPQLVIKLHMVRDLCFSHALCCCNSKLNCFLTDLCKT